MIERILGAPLPRFARRHAAWWANEAVGKDVQARSWQEAGFRVASVDRACEVVVFAR